MDVETTCLSIIFTRWGYYVVLNANFIFVHSHISVLRPPGSSGFWKRSSSLRAPNISSVDRTRVNSFYSTVVVIKFC